MRRLVMRLICVVLWAALAPTARASVPSSYAISLFAGQETSANGGIGDPCAHPPICGDGQPATSAELFGPSGLAVDRSGSLYIADTADNEVRRVSNGIIFLVAGDGTDCATKTVFPVCGDGGPATSAELTQPSGVAVDAGGNVFIADTGDNEVRMVSPTGKITTIAGNGTSCQSLNPPVAPKCGDGGPASKSELSAPAGLAIDAYGNLYIADQGDGRVREISAGTITTIAGGGSGCGAVLDCGNGGPATHAQLQPNAVTVDLSGRVFITDQAAVYEVSVGSISRIAGTGTSCASPPNCGDGGPATSAQLSLPSGVAVDGSGNVLIADGGDAEVREVSGGTIYRIAGVGHVCNYDYPNAPHCFYDGGPATSAELAATGIALGPAGAVYVAGATEVRLLTPAAPARPLLAAVLPGTADVTYYGRTAVQLACAGGTPGSVCRGRLTLRAGSHLLVHSGYELASGSVGRIALQLGTAALSRLGHAAGKRLTATTTVVPQAGRGVGATITLQLKPADAPAGSECGELARFIPSFLKRETKAIPLPSLSSADLPIAITAEVSLGSVGICRRDLRGLVLGLGPSPPGLTFDITYSHRGQAFSRLASYLFAPLGWRVPSGMGASVPPAPRLEWLAEDRSIKLDPTITFSDSPGGKPEVTVQLVSVPIQQTSATLVDAGGALLKASIGAELSLGLKVDRRELERIAAEAAAAGMSTAAAAEYISLQFQNELTPALNQLEPLGYEPFLQGINAQADAAAAAGLLDESAALASDATTLAAEATSVADNVVPLFAQVAADVGDVVEEVAPAALVAAVDAHAARAKHFASSPQLNKTRGQLLKPGKLKVVALRNLRLRALHRAPLPRGQIATAVHTALALPVPARVGALAVTATRLQAAGQLSLVAVGLQSGAQHTAQLVLDGPGYHATSLLKVRGGGAAAAISLPRMLAPGRWTIAVEDLSGITFGPPNASFQGTARVRMALFTVSRKTRRNSKPRRQQRH